MKNTIAQPFQPAEFFDCEIPFIKFSKQIEDLLLCSACSRSCFSNLLHEIPFETKLCCSRQFNYMYFAVGLRLNKDFENRLLTATTPFAFVELGESNFIRFLKLIGCDNSKIGNYCTSVKSRNDAAHSNGRIFFNDQAIIDQKIEEVLRYIDEIQTHSKPIIDECLITFLNESNNPDEREFYDDTDQIREVLIHGNYLSQKDIEHMLTFDITKLSGRLNYAAMKQLFEKFEAEYAVA